MLCYAILEEAVMTALEGETHTRFTMPGGWRDNQYSGADRGGDHMDTTNREPLRRDRHMTLFKRMPMHGQQAQEVLRETEVPQYQ